MKRMEVIKAVFFRILPLFFLWGSTAQAQIFADYSEQKFTGACMMYDTVRLLYKGAVDTNSRAVLSARFNANNSVFKDRFVAESIKFNNNATFVSTQFEREATFKNSVFWWKSDFSQVFFENEVNFEQTAFYEMANFKHATFKRSPIFFNTYFAKGASFQGVTFPQKILFIDVDISEKPDVIVDFGGAYTGDSLCLIDLRWSDIARIVLDYTKYKLYFDERYSSINKHDSVAIKELYEGLMKNQWSYGFTNGYHKAKREYKEWLKALRSGKWTLKQTPPSGGNDNPSTVGWLFIVVLALLMAWIYWDRNKTPSVKRYKSSTPAPAKVEVVKKAALPPPPVTPPMIPREHIQRNVVKGLLLWDSYQAQRRRENEEFWQEYEALLDKLKKQ